MPSFRQLFWSAILILILLITGSYYFFEFRRIRQINQAIGEREIILRDKKESVRNYQEKVSFYKTQEGIEHLAREQYNLVAPGERVILLQSPDRAIEE